MRQAYWLDPIRPAELLRALLRTLAGNAHVAVEGEPDTLGALDLLSLAGARLGPDPPFRREYGRDSLMIVLPLENQGQVESLSRILAPGPNVVPEVGAIQIERHGCVEFMAGDNFQRECISVGPSVAEDTLRELTRRRVIRGFYPPSEARQHFQTTAGDDD